MTLDYAKGHIPTLFRKIFIPTLLGMIFNALITVVDGIFVGQGVGANGIAAVNIVTPVYMAVSGIALMFGVGISVVAGIALSQKDYNNAGRQLTQGTVSASLLMAAVCLVMMLIPDPMCDMLGCSADLKEIAKDYLVWVIPGLWCLLFQIMGMLVIRLDRSPKYASLCEIVPAIVNIVLDWWFIFPLGLGVKGAAAATSISIGLGAAMTLYYFFKRATLIRFRRGMHKFFSNVINQIKIGLAALVSEVALSVIVLVGNYVFMSLDGDAGVAAYSIACYLFPVMFMMSSAVAQSAQPIISFNYGAKAMERVRNTFRLSLAVAAGCGLLATMTIALGARGIVGLFISSDSVAGVIAAKGLPLFALCSIFFSINMTYIGYYQSIGKGGRAMIYTLLRSIIYILPAFIILSHLFGRTGAWLAIPVSEMLTMITVLLTGKYDGRQLS